MESGELPERRRRPVTALDVGKVGCLAALIGVFVAFTLVRLRQGQEDRGWVACLSNMIELYKATRIYAVDHGDRLPAAASWCDDLESPYLGSREYFYCPEQPGAYGYAMNSRLDSAGLADVATPAETPLYFESGAGRPNAADPLLSLPDPPRHQVGNNVLFVAGNYGVWRGTAEAALEMGPESSPRDATTVEGRTWQLPISSTSASSP
ncbi:MAG: hypothetical protein ACE5R4_04480 [Armatimonadota bacterium]